MIDINPICVLMLVVYCIDNFYSADKNSTTNFLQQRSLRVNNEIRKKSSMNILSIFKTENDTSLQNLELYCISYLLLTLLFVCNSGNIAILFNIKVMSQNICTYLGGNRM